MRNEESRQKHENVPGADGNPTRTTPDDNPESEVDAQGSDQESNVTGRSKPASDGVAQHDRNRQKPD